MGRGEGSPLYDPGSKSCYREGESYANITINGMGKRTEVECIAAAALKMRHPSKLHQSTRSGRTAVVLCNWSMYNFSIHTQQTWSVTLLAPDA